MRQLIAIEVKGGRDFSNIHNRVGEAEKSHHKARAAGLTECWTIVNVDRTDLEKAKRESPSTNRFFRLSDLLDQSSDSYRDFHDRVQALTGIADVNTGLNFLDKETVKPYLSTKSRYEGNSKTAGVTSS